MALPPPLFASAPGRFHAADEFRILLNAVGLRAADLLADLADIHNFGSEADLPAADRNATQVRDLYRRDMGGWPVYYTYCRSPFQVVILLAAELATYPAGFMESDAIARLRDI